MTQPDPSHAELHKALFLELAMMLSTSAMQQLGKLVNPMSGKSEVSLEGAQATIDMLAMLEAKTRGNLDKDEERFLRTTLATLQLNFVETSQSSATAKPATPPDTAAPAPAAAPAEGDRKDARFHKSYG